MKPIFALASLLTAFTAAAADDLTQKIKPLIDAHKGNVAMMVKDLDTGEVTAINADAVMPTASLIKMAVMVEAYAQAEEKKIDLAKMITLTKADKVQGSGILSQHFSDGLTLAVRDAVRLMMVFSDNTATNLVIDQVGLKNVNDRMVSLGFKDTKINAKVYRGDTRLSQEFGEKYGLGSTTARDSVGILEQIHTGKLVSADACKAMLVHLKGNDDKEKFPRYLPEGTVIAHKTGSVNASKTDAGIIYVPVAGDKKKTRPIALCVLTSDNEDQRWVTDNAGQVVIAKIAKEVYDHYSK